MTIKINDRVRINPSSKWYDQGNCNPTDCNGSVSDIEGDFLPVYVKWDNDEINSYSESDLIIIEQKAQECDATKAE